MLSTSTKVSVSQFSTGRGSWQCRAIFPLTAALQAGDRGDEGFGWHLWTEDDKCFPVTSTSALASAGPWSSLVQTGRELAVICRGH